jgi:small conductance mechanosensitive channel
VLVGKKKLCYHLEKRRLIRSLVSYLALFAFLILSLTYIGISMAAILTAIGTLGIAVSLGAQHFVSDIIAGLTMVFEGTVHAGDIVDLGVGMKVHHGVVRQIGLRFISLQTRDGNIVTLSNRDVNMTTNMTKLNSRCACEFTISSEYPIEEIEQLLQRELPKIGEKDRRILSGPVYDGIISLTGGSMTLLITAECREEDLTGVQLVINRSLQQIFTQNGYRI